MRLKMLVLSLVAALSIAGAATAGNGKGRFLYTFVGQLTTTPSNCVQCGAITAKGGRLTPPEGGSGPEYTTT